MNPHPKYLIQSTQNFETPQIKPHPMRSKIKIQNRILLIQIRTDLFDLKQSQVIHLSDHAVSICQINYSCIRWVGN